jgi:toxin ParE1/3/4
VIRYSNDAEHDLEEIADYTTDRWGAAQAERYIDNLVGCFEQIEKMPGLGRSCKDIYPKLHRIEQDQQVIFYLPEPGGVLICRVLHQRMLPEYDDFLSSLSENP